LRVFYPRYKDSTTLISKTIILISEITNAATKIAHSTKKKIVRNQGEGISSISSQ
jgi:hypothetical protein